jgi:hypothetical protein
VISRSDHCIAPAANIVPPSVTVMDELVNVTETLVLATALAKATTPIVALLEEVSEIVHRDKVAVRAFRPAFADAATTLVAPRIVLLTKLALNVEIVPVATLMTANVLAPVMVEVVILRDDVRRFPLVDISPPVDWIVQPVKANEEP